MAKDSTTDSKVGGLQKTRRFYLVEGQDHLRGLALTTIHPQVVMGSTQLGTPVRLCSFDELISAILIYITKILINT